MNFAAALAALARQESSAEAYEELARSALDEGEEEQALPILQRVAAQRPSPRLLQWKGLLERSLDEHGSALESFTEAARLDPQDAGIAHGHARVALEAGVQEAERLYERAKSLAPGDSAVLLGLAAARLAAGQGSRAEAELDALLAQAPLWLDGHRQLAQLRSMLGRRHEADASLRRALSQAPAQQQLWQTLFDLQIKQERFDDLLEEIGVARQSGAPAPLTEPFDAVARAELGQTDEADRLFAGVAAADGPPLSIWRIRHLIRSGRAADAIPLIDAELGGGQAASIWPYASVAWRLAGDPRADWLDGEFVSIFDLAEKLPPLEEVGRLLRSLHVAKGEYLDQSLRGGTQTDGPLFSRLEPQIRALRAAVVEAVEAYVSQLPPVDARHPLLSCRRGRGVRFSGSWSVRLRESGFHVPHVHPQGWISSALYIVLPDETGAGDHSGWLQIGEPPPTLGTEITPSVLIEPKPGRLVLFPSWMWHGTRPFSSGERLSVAFDVAPPK